MLQKTPNLFFDLPESSLKENQKVSSSGDIFGLDGPIFEDPLLTI